MNVNYHDFVKKMDITAKTEKVKCARPHPLSANNYARIVFGIGLM
jgi:hypothetical protein